MGELTLYLLLVTVLGAHAQWHFQVPKREGEQCGRIGRDVWTCQKQSDCASIGYLTARSRRITCNSNQGERVVCCPAPQAVENRLSVTISERKCQEYQSRVTCPTRTRGEFVQSSLPPLPGLEPDEDESEAVRKKRKACDDDDEDDDDCDPFEKSDSSDTSTDEVTILGGRRAEPKELPHSALIGYGAQNRISWNCGGTLVSERFVLSAAHCSFDGGPNGLGPARFVRLGDLDYDSTSDDRNAQQYFIKERIEHPQYNNLTLYNDIALFRLDRPVVFNEYVLPACLHTDLRDPVGLATASGWGRTGINTPTNTVLRVVDLGFVPCHEGLKEKVNGRLPTGINQETMICAWRNAKDACRGDSGGPLILADWGGSCLPRLVGLTSFGPACEPSLVEDAGVYTRVASYRTWIESIVWPSN